MWLNVKSFLLLACTFMLVLDLTAQKPKLDFVKKFEKANGYYAAQQYQQAADSYNQLLTANVQSATLYYNLGNTYYKLRQYHLAILNYERALKIDATQHGASFNLKLAQANIVDKQVPPNFVDLFKQRVVTSLTTNQWALTSGISFLLGVILVVLAIQGVVPSPMAYGLGVWFGVTALVTLALGRLNYSALQQPYAIVTTARVEVKSSPTSSSTTLFNVHAGIKVLLTDSVSNWYEVSIPNQQNGWVERNHVAKI